MKACILTNCLPKIPEDPDDKNTSRSSEDQTGLDRLSQLYIHATHSLPICCHFPYMESFFLISQSQALTKTEFRPLQRKMSNRNEEKFLHGIKNTRFPVIAQCCNYKKHYRPSILPFPMIIFLYRIYFNLV